MRSMVIGHFLSIIDHNMCAVHHSFFQYENERERS